MSQCGSVYKKKISVLNLTPQDNYCCRKGATKHFAYHLRSHKNFKKIAPLYPHVITENIEPLGLYDFLTGTQ